MNATQSEQILTEAIVFATHAHHGQQYGDEPFIRHPAAVAAVLYEHGFHDPALLAAAWLHDVLEDTDTSLMELRVRFGVDVADTVWRVSDEDAPERHLRHALTWPKIMMSEDATVVKVADRIANVRASQAVPAKRAMYAQEHAGFRLALHRPGSPAEPLWRTLDAILAA